MTTDMMFLTVDQFKSQTNTVGHVIDFLISKDEKLFAVVANGKSYKAQQSLDVHKPVRFMYSEAEGFDKGCFTNVNPPKVKFSL